MTIDNRSILGQQLEVGAPAELDLSQLDTAAGELLRDRMASGKSREEAIIGVLNFAAKLMVEGVIHLDTTKIYEAHPEVSVAVERIVTTSRAGQKISTARALTRIMVTGSKPPEAKPGENKKSEPEDLFKDLDGLSDLFNSLLKPPKR